MSLSSFIRRSVAWTLPPVVGPRVISREWCCRSLSSAIWCSGHSSLSWGGRGAGRGQIRRELQRHLVLRTQLLILGRPGEGDRSDGSSSDIWCSGHSSLSWGGRGRSDGNSRAIWCSGHSSLSWGGRGRGTGQTGTPGPSGAPDTAPCPGEAGGGQTGAPAPSGAPDTAPCPGEAGGGQTGAPAPSGAPDIAPCPGEAGEVRRELQRHLVLRTQLLVLGRPGGQVRPADTPQ